MSVSINYTDRNQGQTNIYTVVFNKAGEALSIITGQTFSFTDDPNLTFGFVMTEGREGFYSAEINTLPNDTYNFEIWAASDILNPSRTNDKLLSSGSFVAKSNAEAITNEITIKDMSELVDLQRAVRDLRSRIRR